MHPEMICAPVKVYRSQNNVEITAFVRFTGNYAYRRISSAGITYAEAAAAAIEAAWSGSFSVYGQTIQVHTTVQDRGTVPHQARKIKVFGKGQKILIIKIIGGTPLSRIMRSHERMRWRGILLNNESISNWSIAKSSSPIVLYTTENFQGSSPYQLLSPRSFEQIAAHEFGHALGLGDAYNAGYRGGTHAGSLDGYYAPRRYAAKDASGREYEVTVPDDDMMLFNQRVSDNDMRMVLDAYATGKQQFFPQGSKDWNSR